MLKYILNNNNDDDNDISYYLTLLLSYIGIIFNLDVIIQRIDKLG